MKILIEINELTIFQLKGLSLGPTPGEETYEPEAVLITSDEEDFTIVISSDDENDVRIV
jgi:hypothetical protein